MAPYVLKEANREHCAFGSLVSKAALDLCRDIFGNRLAAEENFIPALFKDGQVPEEATQAVVDS
jgi:hypothetical protein